jgi:signal transduction histidine kinase
LRERAVACGGSVEIIGMPGAGTVVTLRVPFAGAPA